MSRQMTAHDTILILDFGSQYTQLIARRVRESRVFCEILPFDAPLQEICERNPKGLILSGGPSSVYEKDAPTINPGLLNSVNCPILGICFGLQALAHVFGGEVRSSEFREYGYAKLQVTEPTSPLFINLPLEMDVWMSHGDHVTRVPEGFRVTALTEGTLNAFEDLSRCIFGVQFHPEVAHTKFGLNILQNFLFEICGVRADWSPRSIISEQVEKIREEVGDLAVICGLSGGVDSTVAAAIVHKAIGSRQTCVFVNNGLLRDGEFESTCSLYLRNMELNLKGIDASAHFMDSLKGVVDPEEKRRIIGHIFIEVFEGIAREMGDVKYLVQGTLYPDVIESVSVHGPSAVIKSHHNVGGLPERMSLKLIEPLRDLFKDEVRAIGMELGVPDEILHRHPFPGPGLAVRMLGEIDERGLDVLRNADRILEEELKLGNFYGGLWQAFPVLLPVSTVGVMGDFRTYERVLAIRAVTSTDGMTADWARLPHDLLGRISTRLVSEIKGVNRVVYDISSKPPSTIEWE